MVHNKYIQIRRTNVTWAKAWEASLATKLNGYYYIQSYEKYPIQTLYVYIYNTALGFFAIGDLVVGQFDLT